MGIGKRASGAGTLDIDAVDVLIVALIFRIEEIGIRGILGKTVEFEVTGSLHASRIEYDAFDEIIEGRVRDRFDYEAEQNESGIIVVERALFVSRRLMDE